MMDEAAAERFARECAATYWGECVLGKGPWCVTHETMWGEHRKECATFTGYVDFAEIVITRAAIHDH